jgi:hypothetical protein
MKQSLSLSLSLLPALLCSLTFIQVALAASDCSCGTCQVVDCGAGEDACDILGGKTSCTSGSADWVCELDECKSSECENMCEDSQCYSATCGISEEVCFHESSKITYKGKEYSFQQLLNGAEEECIVPHTPKAVGIKIATSCGKHIRVTDTHLVMTADGFQHAKSLKEGDVLHGDYEGGEECHVLSVEKEATQQQYFGLNCLHSEVLANGIHTSTFGDIHVVPAAYMRYAGSILGIHTASRIGTYFSSLYHLYK